MNKSLSWSIFATTVGLVSGASPVRAQDGSMAYMRDPAYARFQSPGPAGDCSVADMRDPAYGPRPDVYINNPNWEPPSYMRDPAYAQRADVYINNPDFVQYWLKKSFDENWTASDAK